MWIAPCIIATRAKVRRQCCQASVIYRYTRIGLLVSNVASHFVWRRKHRLDANPAAAYRAHVAACSPNSNDSQSLPAAPCNMDATWSASIFGAFSAKRCQMCSGKPLCKEIGIHQICDGHHILFVKSALSIRHEDGGCYAKSTLPSRYGYTSPRCHGRSCGRWGKDISRQKPLLCRRARQWGRDSCSCEHEKLSDRAVAAVIYRPNV
jgi:hypothetical protein